MKATLHFNLPEDQYEFDAACKAKDYKLALSELGRFLFNMVDEGDWSEEQRKLLEEIWDKFRSETEDLRWDE